MLLARPWDILQAFVWRHPKLSEPEAQGWRFHAVWGEQGRLATGLRPDGRPGIGSRRYRHEFGPKWMLSRVRT